MNSLSSEINEMELQNIRHLVLGYDMEADKYNCYAQDATDPSIKQFFQQSAQSATRNKQQLMQFLQ